jgi:hypothetical protein
MFQSGARDGSKHDSLATPLSSSPLLDPPLSATERAQIHSSTSSTLTAQARQNPAWTDKQTVRLCEYPHPGSLNKHPSTSSISALVSALHRVYSHPPSPTCASPAPTPHNNTNMHVCTLYVGPLCVHSPAASARTPRATALYRRCYTLEYSGADLQ